MGRPQIAFLNSADWFVPNAQQAVSRMRELLGLEPSKSDLSYPLPTHHFDAMFFCAQDRMTVAPTKIEFIEILREYAHTNPSRIECDAPPLLQIEALQGDRPQKMHATNIVVENFDETVAWFAAQDIPVFVERGCEHLQFPRGWVSWVDSGTRYTPGFDTGLCFEFVPIEAFSPRMAQAVANPPALAGGNSRVGARTFLVDDLTAAAATLETTLGIEPESSGTDDYLGVRTISYSFRHPGGAHLVLATPTDDGFARDYFNAWGAGLFMTQFAFADPEAMVRHAESAGARIVRGSSGNSRRTLLSDDVGLPGILLEFAPLP